MRHVLMQESVNKYFLCLHTFTHVLAIQVCIHRAARPVRDLVGAAVSQSEETSDRGDQLNDDSTCLSNEILPALKVLLEFICSVLLTKPKRHLKITTFHIHKEWWLTHFVFD